MPASPDPLHLARGAATAALAGAGLAVHLTVQRLAPAARFHASDWLVELTPFLPWTAWIYLLFFPLLVATAVLVPPERHRRLVLAWALASVVTWALVLVVPVTFPRPEAAAIADPFHAWVFDLLYGIDAAHVTFPCLHAALTAICWLALRDRDPRLRRGFLVVAVAIVLSTMTTRQHLVTDNLAGLAIAWVCVRIALPVGAALPPARLKAVGATPRDRARKAPG